MIQVRSDAVRHNTEIWGTSVLNLRYLPYSVLTCQRACALSTRLIKRCLNNNKADVKGKYNETNISAQQAKTRTKTWIFKTNVYQTGETDY